MTLRSSILSFARWAEKNQIALIYGAGALLLPIVILWALSLLAGFWLGAIYGLNFNMTAGTAGVGALATAGATVYGIARAGQAKYLTDSRFNSRQGEKPYKDGETEKK